MAARSLQPLCIRCAREREFRVVILACNRGANSPEAAVNFQRAYHNHPRVCACNREREHNLWPPYRIGAAWLYRLARLRPKQQGGPPEHQPAQRNELAVKSRRTAVGRTMKRCRRVCLHSIGSRARPARFSPYTAASLIAKLILSATAGPGIEIGAWASRLLIGYFATRTSSLLITRTLQRQLIWRLCFSAWTLFGKGFDCVHTCSSPPRPKVVSCRWERATAARNDDGDREALALRGEQDRHWLSSRRAEKRRPIYGAPVVTV